MFLWIWLSSKRLEMPHIWLRFPPCTNWTWCSSFFLSLSLGVVLRWLSLIASRGCAWAPFLERMFWIPRKIFKGLCVRNGLWFQYLPQNFEGDDSSYLDLLVMLPRLGICSGLGCCLFPSKSSEPFFEWLIVWLIPFSFPWCFDNPSSSNLPEVFGHLNSIWPYSWQP